VLVGKQPSTWGVRGFDGFGERPRGRGRGIGHVAGLGYLGRQAWSVDGGLVEPPAETAVTVAFGVEGAPAGTAGIASAEVDVEVVVVDHRRQEAGEQVRILEHEGGAEDGNVEVFARGMKCGDEGDQIHNACEAGATTSAVDVAFVGRFEIFHIADDGSEVFDVGRLCGAVVGDDVGSFDSGGEQGVMVLDDGRRCRPVVITVADVMDAELLESAEDLGKRFVVERVLVAEVGDDADGVGEGEGGGGVFGGQSGRGTGA
jgi:hypothetical protein